jgi:hypothetical protein
MKRVVVSAALLVVLILVLAVMASAQTQPNWRIYMTAADTNGQNSYGDMTIGVYSGATDGYGVDGTASDNMDNRAPLELINARAVVGVFGGKCWNKDIKSPKLPTDPAYNAGRSPWDANRKVWDLRVAGLGSASSLDTVLTIRFVNALAGIPPLTLPVYGGSPVVYAPVSYKLRMVDNRGVAGAPANGAVWTIPMPATWQATSFFSLTLPTINAARDDAYIISHGYNMQFYQETPEPSGLLALAGGIMGLAGYGLRRRRS